MGETAKGRFTSLFYAGAAISSSPTVRAAREQPADGFVWVWSDGRVFIGDIVAVGGQKRSRAMGKPFPGTPENDCGTRSTNQSDGLRGGGSRGGGSRRLGCPVGASDGPLAPGAP